MNFHSKPFDEATCAKLAIFADYTREWLPVFLHSHGNRITILDLFAGPGQDAAEKEGSPLLILREIRKYTDLIRSSGTQVHLHLNEAAVRKARTLKKVMEAQQIPDSLCTWKVDSQDFDSAFNSLCPQLLGSNNLIFLDQQGMKFISDSTFLRLTELPATDFIFFIASSSLRRFADHPHFSRHLSIPKGAISARAFNDTHRVVTDYYRKLGSSGESVGKGRIDWL